MAYAIIHRLQRFLSQQVIHRRLPHGLLSWRYLWPGQDDRVRLHRQLWWENGGPWPRSAWWLQQLWLWLRWSLWDGWRASWRTVRRLGPEVRAREGLSLAQQGRRTLALALGWCISPGDVYLFRLYRQSAAALDYVFDHELPAYHRWRSAPLGLKLTSLALLQDKFVLAEALGKRKVPVVPSLACIARHTDGRQLAGEMQAFGRVFCKTRSGSRGLGAFAAWRKEAGLEGRTFEGQELAGIAAVEGAWQKLLAMDDALIQPCLANHPALAPLAYGDEAITVRFISQWRDSSLSCLCATLEIQAGRDEKSGRTTYTILPIKADTGSLLPFPEEVLLTQRAREQAARIWELATPNISLPHWIELAAASFRAHEMFPDVWAIAWDWVITPDGPLLLEGNSGWGVATPQILHGGFLGEENRKTTAT